MSLSIENSESISSNTDLVKEAIRQSNERRECRKAYAAYLTDTLPALIQQSSVKPYFRQAHHNRYLTALGIKPKRIDHKIVNNLSSVMNTSCGLAYLGLHFDELVRTHAQKLAPASAGLALTWNIINIVVNIAIIHLLFKQKLYAEAAAMSGATGLLGSSTVGNFLTLHSIHVIQGVAASSVGVFGYFAFAACAGVAFGVSVGHAYGAQKRKAFYQTELTKNEQQLSQFNQNPTKYDLTKINKIIMHTVALKNLIKQEDSFIQEHKKCSLVYGPATIALTALSTVGLLITAGVITGAAASVVSMGIVPATLAVISISVTLWSYYHRVNKADITDPIKHIRNEKPSIAICKSRPEKMKNKAHLFQPAKITDKTIQHEATNRRACLGAA